MISAGFPDIPHWDGQAIPVQPILVLVGYTAIGEHPRGYRQHCMAAGLDCHICGRARVLTYIPCNMTVGRAHISRQQAAYYDITNHNPKTQFVSGLPGRDSSTFQAFCVSVSSSFPVFSWRKYPGGGESSRAKKSYTATRPAQKLHGNWTGTIPENLDVMIVTVHGLGPWNYCRLGYVKYITLGT